MGVFRLSRDAAHSETTSDVLIKDKGGEEGPERGRGGGGGLSLVNSGIRAADRAMSALVDRFDKRGEARVHAAPRHASRHVTRLRRAW